MRSAERSGTKERKCLRHERCAIARHQHILELEHYPEMREPGVLAGSTPLKQWRERGRWLAEYDR
jgi:hypothetical protein